MIGDYVNDVFDFIFDMLESCHLYSDTVFKGFDEITMSSSYSKAMSGKQYFELPKWIANKKACVNLKNTDDKCFFWALMASKYYDKVKATSNSATEIRHYKKFMSEIIEPEGCEYPVKISDIEKWENANNMKINVVKVMEQEEEFENVYI